MTDNFVITNPINASLPSMVDGPLAAESNENIREYYRQFEQHLERYRPKFTLGNADTLLGKSIIYVISIL